MSRRLPHPWPGFLLLALAASAHAQVAWSRVAIENNSSRALAFDPVGGRMMMLSASRWDQSRGSQTAFWNGQHWRLATPRTAPAGRLGHALVTDTTRRRVVLFGGQSMNDTWEWDGTDWTQRNPTVSPPPRLEHAMAFDAARGRVVLFGGRGAAALADTWEWDGTNWRQATPATSPPARFDHQLAFDPVRRRVLLFGGLRDFTFQSFGDTWEWDGTNWSQLNPAASPAPRFGHGLVEDPARARLLLVGGVGAGTFADQWSWDGTSWAQLPGQFPASSYGHTVGGDPIRGVVLDMPGEAPGLIYVNESATYEWNGASWRRASPGTSPRSRYDHAMSYDSVRGRVVLFGGSENLGPVYGDTWEWDGSVWADTGQGLPARGGAALGFDPVRARTVMFGGLLFQGVATWEWDGLLWTQRFPAQQPTALRNLTFDPVSNRLVGIPYGGGPLWEWDGAAWNQRTPVHRSLDALVAADTGRQRLVAYDSLAQTTWEWIGQDWTQRTPRTLPPSAYRAQLLHDAQRGRTVLIVEENNDVWEWDGTDWTLRVPNRLRPSRSTAAAYDSRRGRVVLFGGDYVGFAASGNANGDTWEYGPVFPANAEAFGSGCSGSAGTPTLGAASASLPWLGDRFRLELRSLPPGSLALLWLGLSRTAIGPFPLPIDLTPIGLTGCSLLQSADLAFPLANVAGQAAFDLDLPVDVSLLGGRAFAQGLVADRFANPFGATTSNGAALTLGGR